MAAPLLAEKLYTAEEFLALPDADDYELDDGRLVERSMGAESDNVAYRIAALIDAFSRANRLGHLMGGGTNLKIFAGRPRRMPRADVIFVRRERLDYPPAGVLEVAPNLIVESVSPTDNAQYLDRKVQEYLSAGVELVWVVYPEAHAVVIHRPGRFSERLAATDTISGEDVLPGFSCRVAEFFPSLD